MAFNNQVTWSMQNTLLDLVYYKVNPIKLFTSFQPQVPSSTLPPFSTVPVSTRKKKTWQVPEASDLGCELPTPQLDPE